MLRRPQRVLQWPQRVMYRRLTMLYLFHHIVQAQKSPRFPRLIFSLFLIGMRQAKVVDGMIYGNRCIHGGIVLKNGRFRPRLVGAI